MIEGRLLVAYHGCDITTRDDLVSGKLAHLDHSKNPYDWLGPGAYFFEGDAERALMFANASHNNPTKMYTARPIGTPAVAVETTGSPIPENDAAASEDDAEIIYGFNRSAKPVEADFPARSLMCSAKKFFFRMEALDSNSAQPRIIIWLIHSFQRN